MKEANNWTSNRSLMSQRSFRSSEFSKSPDRQYATTTRFNKNENSEKRFDTKQTEPTKLAVNARALNSNTFYSQNISMRSKYE